MCGLVGVIEGDTPRREADLHAVVESMSAMLRHRGPDDAGTWVEAASGVALGFRRLSIVDLTAAGHQPQTSHDGRFVVVFNGEIYNHQVLRSQLSAHCHEWAGHSDTETLLAGFSSWGVKRTLADAVGMFAIAAWDRLERRLYLARDRFGEKPLYYGWVEGAFVFGSELAALRQYPGFRNPIDRNVLALYLQHGCVPAPYSIFERIYKLEPGCILSMPLEAAARPLPSPPFAPTRDGDVELERYWSLNDVVHQGMAAPLQDEPDSLNQLDEVLSQAVQDQSMADVPLGAFLSGGIDSSLIVALMQAQSSQRVHTFTIGFDEAEFNEAPHAKAVAQHLGTDHLELYVSSQQALDVVPSLPAIYSEPFADSSQIPTYLVSRLARAHVTVALSGDGADELFGGYSRYSWNRRVHDRLGWLPRFAQRGLGTAVQMVPASAWNAVGNAGLGVSRLGEKAHKLGDRLRGAHDLHDQYTMLMSIWPASTAMALGARPSRTADSIQLPVAAGPEERMMAWDAVGYLPDDILQKVDRASMAVSLESRAPFLDHRVAELAWRLPLRMKIRNGTGKWILRQLLARRVPAHLTERPKMGFGVPIGSWLRGPLREWAEELLSERRLTSEGFLDPGPVRQKWAEHLSGARNWQHELWCVLMFEAWLER
ncbi:MAG TPA: asparagine synthase (glutamine-hydrolyzing) [Vicinamibacterales bacterium]|nr:asparagine synthase (glutamine-hydrolyzing) [Vicinamibacterales bacterium]